MNELSQLFSYGFFVKAFITAIFASITCGIIGTYIVSKRIVFISGGITHASFGGVGMAFGSARLSDHHAIVPDSLLVGYERSVVGEGCRLLGYLQRCVVGHIRSAPRC